jgi:hypothetical protein
LSQRNLSALLQWLKECGDLRLLIAGTLLSILVVVVRVVEVDVDSGVEYVDFVFVAIVRIIVI